MSTESTSETKLIIEADGYEPWVFDETDVKSIVQQAVVLTRDGVQFKLVRKTTYFDTVYAKIADYR